MSDPMTEPILGLGTCGWCNINLRAVPGPYPQLEPDGRRHHPGGCIAAARGKGMFEDTPRPYDPDVLEVSP